MNDATTSQHDPTATDDSDGGDYTAYPAPRASSLWHRHGPKPRPLTDAERRHNRELLDAAQYKPHTAAAKGGRSCSPT
ncbi:hypothetical protein [Streptomyces huasconensis]|uniref:hypothetical protein n=1 Tax=Streptomyces huasconensis TaxID=1854574 RepID=UPI0033F879E2